MMITPDTLDFYVVYSPRAGGKYFTYNYTHMTNNEGSHLHDISYFKQDNVVSIVRKPEDAITSVIISGLIRNRISDISESMTHKAAEYLEIHEAMLGSNAVIISFEDLSNRFDEVARYVAKSFNHPIINTFTDRKPETTEEYVATSKLDPRYDEIYSLVSEHALMKLCNDIYAKALDRCIKL